MKALLKLMSILAAVLMIAAVSAQAQNEDPGTGGPNVDAPTEAPGDGPSGYGFMGPPPDAPPRPELPEELQEEIAQLREMQEAQKSKTAA